MDLGLLETKGNSDYPQSIRENKALEAEQRKGRAININIFGRRLRQPKKKDREGKWGRNIRCTDRNRQGQPGYSDKGG